MDRRVPVKLFETQNDDAGNYLSGVELPFGYWLTRPPERWETGAPF
jgi:hypothetical protein